MRVEVPPHRNNAAGASERMEVQLPQKLQRVSSTYPQFTEGGEGRSADCACRAEGDCMGMDLMACSL